MSISAAPLNHMITKSIILTCYIKPAAFAPFLIIQIELIIKSESLQLLLVIKDTSVSRLHLLVL